MNQKMSYCEKCKAVVESDEIDEWTRQCTQCKTITKYQMGWIGQSNQKVVKND
jgi:NAD-dependent SIR2 family protein deacetylase